MNNNEYEDDIKRMLPLESKTEKQIYCMTRGKRCAECDGIDSFGSECKYYVKKGSDKND